MMNPLLTGRLAIKRLYDHEMAPLMARFTLTRMELDVLLFLSNNPGLDTAAEIVQLRMLTKSHVSKAVDHLTERGLIQQARDEKNRRRVHLTLTDAVQGEGKLACSMGELPSWMFNIEWSALTPYTSRPGQVRL